MRNQFSGEDVNLRFDSLIEGGQLHKVLLNSLHDYTLILRGETNPVKSNNIFWFYTHIYNAKAEVDYKFTVIPFTKPIAFFNKGQKIWIKVGDGKWSP